MKRKLKQPTTYEEQISLLFAHNCANTNLSEYAKRNQENVKKIVQDICNGKIAELLVHRYLVEKGKACTPPDFVIYPAHAKSFDADLVCDGINIHVKSCIPSDKWGNSWCFQPNDSLVKSPDTNDWLALVVLGADPYFRLVSAKGVKYGVPRKRGLNKAVIYEDNL